MDAPFEQPGSYHDADTTNPQDYTHMILYLLNVGQSLCGQTRGVLERLCQEVALATQQRARLLLRYQRFPDVADSSSSTMEVNFPVQFRDRTYGTVSIAADGTDPTRPALPLPVGHVLAQVCSWMLYAFEVTALLDGVPKATESSIDKTLTKREREVLALMCRGYDQKAIAKELGVTVATVSKHQQNIYEQLGVHNTHDALQVAFQAGLFSPLEEFLDSW
ncbi:MAG TPA: LuxR C-terminal-related transcriptional regulator [Ktedonobacteraceae bacterium]|jgi:DNA-binding CsgD family transcriptional regulator|nr:LuxR C-terminal-related transcriptional regulator [Ktedonobacteraceae bacterium]